MEFTMTVGGAVAGAAICLLAGTIGVRSVLDAATNGVQRLVLKQQLICGGAYAAALMGMILLAAFGVLGLWAYPVAALLWFGPLLPALTWAHRRLDAAADSESPVTALA